MYMNTHLYIQYLAQLCYCQFGSGPDDWPATTSHNTTVRIRMPMISAFESLIH